MKMEFKWHKTMLYMGGNLLYLLGWVLALIGLGLVQDECKDIVEDNDLSSVGLGIVPFFTEPVGEDCKKGFRLAPQHSCDMFDTVHLCPRAQAPRLMQQRRTTQPHRLAHMDALSNTTASRGSPSHAFELVAAKTRCTCTSCTS